MIRVLHVIDAMSIGGTELSLAKLIERSPAEISHAVCCVRAAGPTADRLRAQGIPITVLHKRPGNDWRPALRIAALCRRMRPDIVHTRNWGSIDGIVGARLARVGVVIHGEHGREAFDPEGTNRRRNRARRVLAPFVNRMVAVSDQLRRWLINDVGIPASKVVLLKNGVDAVSFQGEGDRAAARRAAGYAPEHVVVGTVGRLDPVKNQVALLDALGRLRSAHPHMRVQITGDGPERETLARVIAERQLAAEAVLLGQRSDIPAVLSMLDLFVLPSLGEGMCNTILEAMAAGLPVVATRVGGNPELVEAGTTGQLVPVRDNAALATAIAAYLDNPGLRRAHGAAGRTRVQEEFTLEGMVERYVQLYGAEVDRKRCAA